MKSQLPNDIDDILSHVYPQGDSLPPQSENQPHRTLNVFIIEDEGDSQALPPMVEGTVDVQDNDTTTPLPDDDEQTVLPAPTAAVPTTEPDKTVPPVQPKNASPRCTHACSCWWSSWSPCSVPSWVCTSG